MAMFSRTVPVITENVGRRLSLPPRKLLVHWRGEDVEGYSIAFRRPEFLGALSGTTGVPLDEDAPIHFQNALNYDGETYMSEVKLKAFNEAMQWMSLCSDPGLDARTFSRDAISQATSRCALISSVYEVVAEGESYGELSTNAMENGGFNNMMKSGENEHCTWCVRVRQYGNKADSKKERRHSERTRSFTMEKEVLLALKPMLLNFGGSVDLEDPDCKIYVLDGLIGPKVLARKMADGPQNLFSMAPNTRICITTTPLEPIAAFSLCNIAGISNGQTIFDPFSGSCAILLAAAMIAPTCQTVGVDIAHDGLINRDHIIQDFASRGLVQPKALFRGDSTDRTVRDEARAAVGDEPFDHIITDPPYGIRERMDASEPSPLEKLFEAIVDDRARGKRLLKKGGRLVCFVPCHPEVDIVDILPTQEKADAAGMKFILSREQPLNSQLSRWLVSYACIG